MIFHNPFMFAPSARKQEKKPLDVGFVVDSSSDISGANWNHINNFLLAMVDGIDNVSPAPSGTRFGLISFSDSPRVFFKFNTLTGSRLNVGEVKKLVRNTPRQAGTSRRFDRALQSAERELYSTAGGHRTNARKVYHSFFFFFFNSYLTSVFHHTYLSMYFTAGSILITFIFYSHHSPYVALP